MRDVLGVASRVLVLGLIVFRADAQAQDPIRWESAIRAYVAEDAKNTSQGQVVVFTGSSSIAQWTTLRDDLTPLAVINRGFGGSTLQDVLYWMDTLVLKHRPHAVVLYAGENDIVNGSTPEQVLKDFQTFAARVSARQAESRVYFLAIKPSVARWSIWPTMQQANRLVEKFSATQAGVHYVDTATPMLDALGRPKGELYKDDNIHLNARGYALWSSVIKTALLHDLDDEAESLQ